MNWSDIILGFVELLQTGIWAGLIGLVIWWFKGDLRRLTHRVQEAQGPGFQVRFLEKVRERADEMEAQLKSGEKSEAVLMEMLEQLQEDIATAEEAAAIREGIEYEFSEVAMLRTIIEVFDGETTEQDLLSHLGYYEQEADYWDTEMISHSKGSLVEKGYITYDQGEDGVAIEITDDGKDYLIGLLFFLMDETLA